MLETARAMFQGRAVILVVCEDVTERKRAEEALRTTEQRLSTVIANSPIILFALDRAGVFTLSEGKGLDALGSKPGQVVGKSVFDVYGDVPPAASAVRRALAGEARTEVWEVRDLVFETHFLPYFDAQGAVAGVNGVATTITERRRAERSYAMSEGAYRNIFEAVRSIDLEQDFSRSRPHRRLKAGGTNDFESTWPRTRNSCDEPSRW